MYVLLFFLFSFVYVSTLAAISPPSTSAPWELPSTSPIVLSLGPFSGHSVSATLFPSDDAPTPAASNLTTIQMPYKETP